MKAHTNAAVFIGLTTLFCCGGPQAQVPVHHARVRVYFVAAEEINWNYTPLGRDNAMGQPLTSNQPAPPQDNFRSFGNSWKKAIFREYTDAKFSTPAPRRAEDAYLGFLGPVLRGEVGDTIKVMFKNKASRPYSMHPHGVFYAKDSEGVMYNDGTDDASKTGGMVPPGGTHIYVWQIPERAGPGPSDPSSILWLYHSHVDELRDIASGLFGPIIVTARGKAREDGSPLNVDHEFVTVFISVDEFESWYRADNASNFTEMQPHPALSAQTGSPKYGLQHSINGYMFGNMPTISMKKGEHVRWYLATLGDSNNVHTPHWHGNLVTSDGHRVDVLPLLPGQTQTVDMIPDDPGVWLFHCHVSDHMAGGMSALYEVRP